MAAGDRLVWLAWRRSGAGYPAVYHAAPECATRRGAHRPRRVPLRRARKVARVCRTCERAGDWPAMRPAGSYGR